MRIFAAPSRRQRSTRPPRPDTECLALRLLALLLLTLILAAVPATLSAQPLADTLITWRGYAREAEAQVVIYPAPPDDERRDRTIIVRELARSKGPSTLADVRYLADRVARTFQIDPARAYWIMHWGAFSYPGATGDKELFLRVTFRRSDSGRLSSPYWRSVSKNDVRELTARRYQSLLPDPGEE
jgi:hypothetical protein